MIAIESSTLHGRHTCGSKIVMGLLMKTRQGLELLHKSLYASSSILPGNMSSDLTSSALHHLSAYPSSSSTSRMTEREKEMVKEKEKDLIRMRIQDLKSHRALRVNDSEESLESALLQMCRHLEVENSKLECSVTSLKKGIEESAGTRTDDLIPHYRTAIVRSVTIVCGHV